MRKFGKALLGLVTIFPAAMMIAYLFSFQSFFSSLLSGKVTPEGPPTGMCAIFVLEGIAILLGLGLAGAFTYHVYHAGRVAADRRGLWTITLFIGYVIALPIYWWLNIWSEPRERAKLKPLRRRGRIALGVASFAPFLGFTMIFVGMMFSITQMVATQIARVQMEQATPVGQTPGATSETAAANQAPPTMVGEKAGANAAAPPPATPAPFSPPQMPAGFPPMPALPLAALFINMAVFWIVGTIFVVHLFHTARLTKQQRILWALLIFLLGMFTMPIYWLLYVLPKPKPVKAVLVAMPAQPTPPG